MPAMLTAFEGYFQLKELGYPDFLIAWFIRGFAKMVPPMFDVWLGTDVCQVQEKLGWRAALRRLRAICADDALLSQQYEACGRKPSRGR